MLDARIGGFLWLGAGEFPYNSNHKRETARRYSLAQFIREYQAGLLPEKSFAILSYETAKLGVGRVPAMGRKRILGLDQEGERVVKEACTCPQCGAIVSTEYDDAGQPAVYEAITPGKKAEQFIGTRRRTCQAPTPKWTWNPETQEHEWQVVDADGRTQVCGAPLYQETSIRREAAARYVQRKAKNFLPVLLIDEIHEAKAKGTGNGWALSVLSGCCAIPFTSPGLKMCLRMVPTPGRRDQSVLAVMLGCGLRRSEVSALTFGHVEQRDGHWAVVDMRGKGSQTHTVPMPSWAKLSIGRWAVMAGLEQEKLERIFRAVNKGDKLAEERKVRERIISDGYLTPQGVADVVREYAQQCGLGVAAHDLRRTFAKLVNKGGSALEQIQLSLGHASIQTTERYLGLEQDLQDASCDRLGLRVDLNGGAAE